MVQIARDWVKVDAAVLSELKNLARKVPRPQGEMSARNRKTLRAFDDPRVLQQLDELPKLLWAEAKAAPAPSKWTLAKAQAAIAIALETYIPLRLRNLTELSFETHIHLRTNPGATSTLELSEEEVKGEHALAFDLPSHLAAMLIDYRDRFAPSIIGRRPAHVFVNVDGLTRKGRATVRYLIMAHLKRAGISLNPHAFRHLAGKRILDRHPGEHEVVKQLLGHDDIETTVRFYTGVDTRRAGNYFQELLESSAAARANSAATASKPA
jgi:integrase